MNFDQLITSLRELDRSLKERSIKMVNVGLSARNWLVGAYLVEFEQHGEDRAAYGESLLSNISKKLDIRGLAVRNLEACRLFYLAYPEIPQSLTAEFALLLPEIPQPPTAESEKGDSLISQTLSGKLPDQGKSQAASGFLQRPEFALPVATLVQKLTFTHFVELLRLDDPLQRAFYEIECVKGGWSVRELKRQIGSLLFERLGLSTDKEKLLRLTAEESSSAQPADLIKDPYIFEFLGLTPKEAFRENDLETALIDHLQDFLLELGKGFCFEDRQKKIRIGRSDYFVDLAFYHRKLHCHVLIELYPMTYEPIKVPLRLRSPQWQRRTALHRLHERFKTAAPRTPRRESPVYDKPLADSAHLLRGLPHSRGRHQTRKILKDRLGQTIPQRASRGLSHGVKVEPFNHANAGQLNTCLNYYRKHEMAEGDNPPVGLLLCTDKDHALVEYALGGMDENFFVSAYKVALPKPEELEAFLLRESKNLPEP